MYIFTRLAASLLFCGILTISISAEAQTTAQPATAVPGATTAVPPATAMPSFRPGPARKRYMFPQKEAQGTYVLNVTKNTDEDSELDGSYTRLSYLPYTLMLAQLAELKKIYYWADSTYQRRLTALPPGGALQLTMYRRGAANADPSLLTLTAQTKSGEEVWRAVPKAGQGRFWNRDLYKVEQTIPFVKTADNQPLNVTVIDPRQRQTFEYVVQVQDEKK
jgi:hypothetical protein